MVGAIPVILDSGYSGCLCFLVLRWAFFFRVSLWGSEGAAWLLDFVFEVALSYGSREMGKLGLFVRGCGFWGLGSGVWGSGYF